MGKKIIMFYTFTEHNNLPGYFSTGHCEILGPGLHWVMGKEFCYQISIEQGKPDPEELCNTRSPNYDIQCRLPAGHTVKHAPFSGQSWELWDCYCVKVVPIGEAHD